jgi:hypothetical protein
MRLSLGRAVTIDVVMDGLLIGNTTPHGMSISSGSQSAGVGSIMTSYKLTDCGGSDGVLDGI